MPIPNGNPQLENGYTRIAHELLEALYQAIADGKIVGKESAIVLWIIRYTYGYQRTNGYFHINFISKNLNLRWSWTWELIKSLERKKIIIRQEDKITINKHYQEWEYPIQQISDTTNISDTADKSSDTPDIANLKQQQLETEVNGKKNHHKDNYINITDISLKENPLDTSKQNGVDSQPVAKVKGAEMQELIKSFCKEMGFQYGSASIKINVKPAKWLLENYKLEQIMNAVRWQKSKIIKEKKNPATFIPNLLTVGKWLDNWLGLLEQEKEKIEKDKKGGYII